MAIDLPPKLWTPSKPAILRIGEPWEVAFDHALRKDRVPSNVRREIIAAIRSSLSGHFQRQDAADILRHFKAPVSAMALPGMVALWGGTPPVEAKSVTFLDWATDATDLTTYSFSINVGAASPTLRLILFFSGGAGSRTFSSGTADGVALAVMTDGSTSAQLGGGNATAGFAIAALPSSSGSITVSLTWSGSQSRAGFAGYRYVGGASNTAHAVGTSNADPGTAALGTVAGGFCLGGGFNNLSSSGTVGGGLTGNFDEYVEGTTQRMAGGLAATPTATTINPSIDWAGTNTNRPSVFLTL